jgi:hypothetical protein
LCTAHALHIHILVNSKHSTCIKIKMENGAYFLFLSSIFNIFIYKYPYIFMWIYLYYSADSELRDRAHHASLSLIIDTHALYRYIILYIYRLSVSVSVSLFHTQTHTLYGRKRRAASSSFFQIVFSLISHLFLQVPLSLSIDLYDNIIFN